MTRKQIVDLVVAAFKVEINPADLVQPHLYEGAASCVAGRVADWLLSHDAINARTGAKP
jgi:hypothetical protein